LLDTQRKLVYRDDLQTALEHFIKAYEGDLPRNTDLQAAFIRKFDALCID
jgi:hypothetical protein